MPTQDLGLRRETFLRRHPVGVYFALAYAISWTGALVVAAPYLLRREPVPNMAGLLMFPAMLLGPSLVGIVVTSVTDGKSGLKDLFGANAPCSSSGTLVRGTAHSSSFGLDRSCGIKDLGLTGFYVQLFSDGHLVRCSSWVFRGNRLDGIGVSQDEQGRRLGPGDLAWAAVGSLARTGDRLPGHYHSARCILVPVFCRVHSGHDGHGL
jgi:hypothetical protein